MTYHQVRICESSWLLKFVVNTHWRRPIFDFIVVHHSLNGFQWCNCCSLDHPISLERFHVPSNYIDVYWLLHCKGSHLHVATRCTKLSNHNPQFPCASINAKQGRVEMDLHVDRARSGYVRNGTSQRRRLITRQTCTLLFHIQTLVTPCTLAPRMTSENNIMNECAWDYTVSLYVFACVHAHDHVVLFL